jgi:molybdopterin-guanine dinucleotide biosynthesis protein A
MGSDKALLTFEGQTLLERQITLLRTAGIDDLLASRPAGTDSSAAIKGVRVIADTRSDSGPLAGIERALDEARHELVLVVAVDMPALSLPLLVELIRACSRGRGVVPVFESQLEPLAAIYPKAARPLALKELSEGRGAAHAFARACIDSDLVVGLEFPASARRLFANWNTPDELPPSVRATNAPVV